MVDFFNEPDPRFSLRLLLEDAVELLRWCAYDDRTGRAILRNGRFVGGCAPMPAEVRHTFARAVDEVEKTQVASVLEQIEGPEGPLLLEMSGWTGRQLAVKLAAVGDRREQVRRYVRDCPAEGIPEPLFRSAVAGYAAVLRGLTSFAGVGAVLALFELLGTFDQEAPAPARAEWGNGVQPTAF